MTLVALHLVHNSIDLHNLTGQGQGESGLVRGEASRPVDAPPVPISSRLAERRGRDGRAPLGWRASRLAGFAGVQHGGTSEASPAVVARAAVGASPKLIAGAAPSGPPARAKEQPLD